MNRALPPGDRGNRNPDPGGPSGPARLVPGLGGLVEGTEDPPQQATPPARYPAARCGRDRRDSALDGVAALRVLGLGGLYLQTKLFADRARQIPTNGMRLPAGRFHQLFDRGARRPLQQVQDPGSFRALAGTFGRLGRFRGRGLFGPLVGRLPAFCSSAGAAAWAVDSLSVFGVFILNAPSAVITAVRTSITLVGPASKVIPRLGDGKAMVFAAR